MFLKTWNDTHQHVVAIEANLVNIDNSPIIPMTVEESHPKKLLVIFTCNTVLKESLVNWDSSGREKTGHDCKSRVPTLSSDTNV